jgi:hypothetical protein
MRATCSSHVRARTAPRALAAAATLAATLTFSACATGERPALVDEPVVTDEVAKQVLDRLDRAPAATFTATYEITPSLTGEPTSATVIQSGMRNKIVIGDVLYMIDGSTSRTCTVGGTDCTDMIDDARISNLNITHMFWSSSAAKRLQADAARSVDGSVGRADNIASRPATCADVQVPSSTDGVSAVTYCALDEGILARYFGADVSIELTSYSSSVDEAALST